MEGEFLSILDQEARKGFMIFTKSLKDLAAEFKCFREHADIDEYTEVRPTKRQVKEVTSKMLYGPVNQRPASSTCRIVPNMMGGFFSARLEPRRKRKPGECSDDESASQTQKQE